MFDDRLALRLLQLWVVALLLVPTDMVVRPLGGQAHLANLIGLGLGALWVASVVTPRSTSAPRRLDEPLRFTGAHLGAALLWVATLGAWVALALRGGDDLTWNGAERWLMVVAAFTGVALVATDGLRGLDQVHRLMATAVAAGALAGLVALVQWRTDLDPSTWLRRIPGLTPSGDDIETVVSRGTVDRVTGTALHPIEFGVGAALMLPAAVHLVLHDHRRRLVRRWVPLGLCALAVPLSVSRSSVLVAVVAVGVMVLTMRPAQRLTALLASPMVAGAVLLAAPGTASTLTTSFLAAGDDTSVQSRLDDLTLVGDLMSDSPWWGLGAGTYQPADVFEILDNQYLLSIVELGLLGTVLLIAATFVVPLHLSGRLRRLGNHELARSLGGVGLATVAASVVAWATFDAWAFPRFVGLGALTLGLLGAASRLATTHVVVDANPSLPSHHTSHHTSKEFRSWTC